MYNLYYVTECRRNKTPEFSNVFINKLADIQKDNLKSGAFLSYDFFNEISEDYKLFKILLIDLTNGENENILWDVLQNNPYFSKSLWKYLNKKQVKKTNKTKLKIENSAISIEPEYEKNNTLKLEIFFNFCKQDAFIGLFSAIGNANEQIQREFFEFMNKNIVFRTFCKILIKKSTVTSYREFYLALYSSNSNLKFFELIQNKIKTKKKKKKKLPEQSKQKDVYGINDYQHNNNNLGNYNFNDQFRNNNQQIGADYHNDFKIDTMLRSEILFHALSKDQDVFISSLFEKDDYCEQFGIDFANALTDYGFFDNFASYFSSGNVKKILDLPYILDEVKSQIQKNLHKRNRINTIIFFVFIVFLIIILGGIGYHAYN